MDGLVRKARKRDKEAFGQLIRQHTPGMYKVAKAILKNDEDAADAIQETALTCWEKLGILKKDKYFKTWMTRILINHCKNLMRQQKRCIVSDEAAKTSETVPDDDREFYALVGELPEDYRMIFLLYYGEGFHTNEIAQIMELNENTVKSRLKRGREKLRQVLCY